MNELALFAGAGGGILGGKMLGWRTVCAVEYEQYPASVLAARQNDGSLEPFPIWSDVCTFDGKPWRGIVDVISGGFPCQDISAAGKGAGIEGERSGLWSEMARIISEVLPQYVWVENSPLLVSRGLTRVLGDLAKMGYDAKWGIVGAHHAGASHKRDRCWVLAYPALMLGTTSENNKKNRHTQVPKFRSSFIEERLQGVGKPKMVRKPNGVACRVDRLKAIGNGQCPQAMKLAWDILSSE